MDFDNPLGEKPPVTFESLFDETSAVPINETLRDDVTRLIHLKNPGSVVEKTHDGSGDLEVKVIGAEASQMYNVFDKPEDYDSWLKQSLHDPSEEELLGGLRGKGA